MMVRIFLTGDNHIGRRYDRHEQGQKLADVRVDALQGMVAGANGEDCDLFVIAGDLFDRTKDVSRKTVAKAVELLGGFRNRVLIIPGNHDYYDANAVPDIWRDFRDAARDRENILLLTEPRPCDLEVRDERVVVYPAGCGSLHSLPGENNLGWIKDEGIEPDEAFRLGIAHGAVAGESLDREGNYFSMTREELNAIPVDVWLIGHTHVPFSGGRIFNAGTPVQTDVSCNTEGQCFILDIESGNGLKPVSCKKFVSGQIRFFRREIAVNGDLRGMLECGLSDIPDNSVVDIQLSGAVDREEYAERGLAVKEALSCFIEGTCDDSALVRRITESFVKSEFPETSFSARFLTALLSDPKEAQMAYDLLKETAK